ncbi:MAG: hypothetical protein ACI8ZM_004051 [Crocinitomix sp.]|jgi:hypothetical protein
MPKKILFYTALVLIIANLTFQEYFGLNAFIISLVYVSITAFVQSKENSLTFLGSPKWWLASLIYIGNGFAVFYMNTELSVWLYVISFFFYTAVNHQLQLSLPVSLMQTAQSFFSGFYQFFESVGNLFDKKKASNKNKNVVRFLMYTIPLIIAIVFLKLYQSADETFYEWTKFINLDWISWTFIVFYCILYIALFGFFFYLESKDLTELDKSLKNNIPNDYTDKVETFMGVGNEKKIAMSLLITLNIMLLLYNFIDLKFVLVDLSNPGPNLRYSDLLHGGVNSLITSIVLVIFILTFIYRGQLNFNGSKFIKGLAVLWLCLNLLMIATTVIKNYEYITHWGLTYKRIGVYIYLLLAALGLLLTIIKIIRIKSLWFLIRNTSIGFLICFSSMGYVNWDKMIVKYNLTELKSEQIDFDYLLSLDDEAYPNLIAYYVEHKNEPQITEERPFWHIIFERFDSTKEYLKNKDNQSTWRSTNIREAQLLAQMNQYNLIFISNKSR